MSPRPAVVLALFVVLAGCAGVGTPDSGGGPTASTPTTAATPAPTTTTTADTTEPHTARGTAQAGAHFPERVSSDVDSVTVTVAPDGNRSQFELSGGDMHWLTQSVHDRGHGVRVVVERVEAVVFDRTVWGYEYYRLAVSEMDTSVSLTAV
jgi:hypothetical protein